MDWLNSLSVSDWFFIGVFVFFVVMMILSALSSGLRNKSSYRNGISGSSSWDWSSFGDSDGGGGDCGGGDGGGD